MAHPPPVVTHTPRPRRCRTRHCYHRARNLRHTIHGRCHCWPSDPHWRVVLAHSDAEPPIAVPQTSCSSVLTAHRAAATHVYRPNAPNRLRLLEVSAPAMTILPSDPLDATALSQT